MMWTEIKRYPLTSDQVVSIFKVQADGIQAWTNGLAWYARRGSQKVGGGGPLPSPQEVGEKMKMRYENG